MTQSTDQTSSLTARFVWDAERARVVEADDAAVALFGEASVLDLVERPFAAQGAFAKALQQLADRATTSANAQALETTLPHPVSGLPLSGVASPIPLADGRMGLALTMRVGDAPPKEAQLQTATRRQATLGEAIAAPGALFGMTGEWLVGNDAALALLGDVTPDLATLLGDPNAATRLTGAALADGLASATFRIATRFGPRLARVTLTRARDPKTGGAAVAAYFNDIADRARVLAAPPVANTMSAQNEPAQETPDVAARARDEARAVLSHVGHELRTPLNAILGFSQIMASERFGPMGNDKYVDYARDIQAGGEHLLGLVDDLLEMARAENGRRDLTFEAVDAAALIQQIGDMLRDEAARRSLTLTIDSADTVPPVVADKGALRQILINLLGNAIKFTRPGGTITMGATSTDAGDVVLSVADTGIGMTAAELAEALEPFGQVEAAQAAIAPPAPPAETGQASTPGLGRGLGRGLGLGLPLARSLAEANKAAFDIESVPARGTTVRITFAPTSVLAT